MKIAVISRTGDIVKPSKDSGDGDIDYYIIDPISLSGNNYTHYGDVMNQVLQQLQSKGTHNAQSTHSACFGLCGFNFVENKQLTLAQELQCAINGTDDVIDKKTAIQHVYETTPVEFLELRGTLAIPRALYMQIPPTIWKMQGVEQEIALNKFLSVPKIVICTLLLNALSLEQTNSIKPKSDELYRALKRCAASLPSATIHGIACP